MRLRLVSVLIGLSLVLGACASAPMGGGGTSGGFASQAPAAMPLDGIASDTANRASEAAGRAAPQANSAKSGSSASTEAAAPRLDRMIVANVNLAINVEDAIAASRMAEVIAERYGGFVSGSSVRSGEKGREATVTVRVPYPRLSEALTDLRAVGQKVTEETRSTQDVTEEFTDTESNIRNLQATEVQLIALMQKASRIEDVMSVQREITNIRGQIERLEGRRRVLENKSDLATIALRFAEPLGQAPRDAWNALEIAEHALAALARIGMGLATFLIWVAVFSPLFVIPAALAWWLIRNRWTRTAAPQTP